MGDGPRLLAGQTGEKGFGPGRRVVTDAQVAVRHAHPWSKLMGDLGCCPCPKVDAAACAAAEAPRSSAARRERAPTARVDLDPLGAARVAAGLRGHRRLRKLRGRDIRREPTLARPDDRADPAPRVTGASNRSSGKESDLSTAVHEQSAPARRESYRDAVIVISRRGSARATGRRRCYFAGCQPCPSRVTCPLVARRGRTRYR